MKEFVFSALIIIAGAAIAVEVLFSNVISTDPTVQHESAAAGLQHQVTPEPERALVAPQRKTNRHVYGDPDTPVAIVEFSDLECPFCARVHPTLKRLVDTYGDQVHWEYRHLPLPSHPKAESAAIAAECIASLGSNDLFWKFLDQALAQQSFLSEQLYEEFVINHGIELDAFTQCRSREAVRDLVQSDTQVARVLGGRGTPFTVIVYADKTIKTVSGALPYEHFESLIAR